MFLEYKSMAEKDAEGLWGTKLDQKVLQVPPSSLLVGFAGDWRKEGGWSPYRFYAWAAKAGEKLRRGCALPLVWKDVSSGSSAQVQAWG